MKISIVVPTYNRGSRLPATLDSALEQTYRDIEVIVVNDGSADETREVADRIEDPRVQVIHHPENRGVAAARNTAIDAARGELIAFLDDDDSWVPEKLERQVPLFGDPEVGLVYCGVAFFDKSGSVAYQAAPRVRGDVYRHLLFKNYMPTPSVVVRRECFERVGRFDESLPALEDYDMWIRIAQRYRVDYVPDVLAHCDAHSRDRLNRPSRIVSFYDRLLAKFEAYPYPSRLLRRRVMAYRHYTLAGMHDVTGDSASARGAYLRSLATWPLSPKSWIGLAATLAGPGASRGLARLKARAQALVNRRRAGF